MESAFEMGFDIQKKSFWRLTPNNFIDMYLGFKKRQQTEMFMVRKLISYLSATVGATISEQDVYPLPLIDAKVEKSEQQQPFNITDEQVKKMEERHKLRKAEYLKIKQNKKNGGRGNRT